MADSYPRFTTRSSTKMANSSMCRNNYSNNYLRFAGKLLFFAFFLIAIPSFPSQAPDFVNQTIFNKFWELLHLMFIGIAVSYGLFCRRSVDDGNLDDTQSDVSGMFHASSIFEDGFSNSMRYSGQGNAGSFNVKNGGFENPYEENVVQAWSSKYFQGEPTVVLAQPNCGLEKYGESSSFVDYKPLGLPVRSLRSRIARRAGSDYGSSESSGSQMNDSSDSSNKSRGRGFGDFGSENSEGESNKSDILGSPIPWRSRSGRKRERVHCNVTRPSHFRPLSVDETQFESQSLRSTISFSSQVSSQSQSPSGLSPSHSSSSESPKSKMSESVKERSPCQSLPPTSPSVLKPMSSKPSVDASYSRQYGDGSMLGTPARKCFKDELKELCDSKKEESFGSSEQISGSFNFDAKPAAPSKASSRGKSVRTFRTSRASVNATSAKDVGERQEDYTKGKSRMGYDEIEEAYTVESEPKIEGHNNFSIGLNRKNLRGESHMLKLTSTENQKKEIQHRPENPAAEPGEDSERENDDFHENSDEETMSGTFSIAGSEVDRKAGEFIAKFREQIRLQRATSVDTPRGPNITGNYFR
ncbi:Phosphotyrosine protein phosphatases superfamily protein [Hibiscus syriacus]|uniref:Phosphotyrosine protein phosphatases superfamily protein n=1 Tax=Hibiscus syriacus TaxID=106335 RepID=A0A6A3ADT1_HIBSY|nr:Phosphotyrosine protein phosphatases superfamily protein [Hibiscus syriacus]